MFELFQLVGKFVFDNAEGESAMDNTTRKASQSSDAMGEAFNRLAGIIATAFSVHKLIQFGAECVNLYNVQSQAELKLQTIMRQRMDATDEQVDSIKKLAIAQQHLGVVGDEAQLAGAQQLATFLNSTEAIESLLPAMNDLAVQQNGLNVTTGTMVGLGNMFGKVMQGQVGALTRVGITFDEEQEKVLKYGTEEEKAATLAQVITDNVGHMNQILAETDAGKIQQVKNNLGDMKEVIGGMIIPFQRIAYEQLDKFIGLMQESLLPRVQDFTDKLLDTETRTNAVNAILHKAFSQEFLDWAEQAGARIGIFTERMKDSAIETFSGKLDGVKNLLKALWDVLRPITETVLKNLEMAFEDLSLIFTNVLMPVLSLIIDHFLAVVTTILTAVTPAVERITAIWQDMSSLINSEFTEVILPVIDQFIEAIRGLWEDNQDKITAIGELYNAVFTAIGDVIDWFNKYILHGILIPAIDAVCGFVSDNMETIKGAFQGAFDIIGGIIKVFTAMFQGDWSGMWEGVKEILNGAFEVVKNIFNLMLSVIGSIGGAIWNKVLEVFNKVKNTIKEKIESARDTVKEAVEKMKGFFNFKWELPKIKLPHFKVSGSPNPFDWFTQGVPKLSVDWYKKAMRQPMIMEQPTAFGVNANGQIMAGGEAGSEVVSGTDTLMAMISEAVDERNAEMNETLHKILGFMEEYIPQMANMQVVMDSGALAGALTPSIDNQLGRIKDLKGRGN